MESDLDGQKLIDEFLTGYYGKAAPFVNDYLEVIHDAVEKSGDWLGCFSELDAKFLSFGVLNEAWGHLVKANAAVIDDPDILHRVEVVHNGILCCGAPD